jgi:N-acetylgalactosamine-6-sulfatase
MPASDDRPNVVFVFTDDLGWGDLGCYGHPHIDTPNVDRLAEEGSLFTQFYANSGVCSPSRAAFMTGQFPARHRLHAAIMWSELNETRNVAEYLDPDVPTVTGLLQDAGYDTAHFGKWHLGGGADAPDIPDYGVDTYRTTGSEDTDTTWDASGEYFRANSTEYIVDEAIEFLSERNSDDPFYMNLWTLLPHATLHPTEEQKGPYEEFSTPPIGEDAEASYDGAMTLYYSSVTAIDRQVGRLMDALDDMGLADDTILVFSSDNGPEEIHIENSSHTGVGSTGPFRGCKRSLYEGGLRMPFVVRWPGEVPAGRVDDESILSGVDWLPTLCDLAGVDLPDGFTPDGESVADVWRGATRERSDPLLWEWRYGITGDLADTSPTLAIRDGDWKLLMNPDRSRVELYDVPNDPMEMDDRSAVRPDLRDALAEEVLAWWDEIPDGPVHERAGYQDYPWPGEDSFDYITPHRESRTYVPQDERFDLE